MVQGPTRNSAYSLSFVLVICLLGCLLGCKADTSSGRDRIGLAMVGAPAAGMSSSVMGVAQAGSSSPVPAGAGGGPAPDPGLPQAGSAPPSSSGTVPPAMGTTPPPVKTFNAGSDPNRNRVEAGHVCARLAQIQCAGEAYCCDNPGRDVAACEAKMVDACTQDGFVDAITLDTRSGFDEERAAAALQTFEDMASRCDPMIQQFGADPNGLMAMVRGTVAEGGRCSPGISGSKAQQAGALASCQDPATTACLPTSALSWTCAPRGGAGANCFTDLNCLDGLYCPNPDLKIAMTQCLARKANGSPCQLGNECTSLTCTGGVCADPTAQSAYCLE